MKVINSAGIIIDWLLKHKTTHENAGVDEINLASLLGLTAPFVEVEELGTATYDDVQDYINFFGDRTLLSGGAITDNGDGTVAIASLTAWSAISDSETAVGKFFDFAGGNTPSLTDMTTNYIYLDYNGGTPQLVVSTSILTHGFKLDHLHVGTAFRDGTETHFHKPTNFELDLGATVDMHHQEEDLVHRVDGLITTETGTRNLAITAGVLYEGLNRHTSLPFDTSRSGTADFNEVNKLHDAGGDFSVKDVGKSVHNTTDDTYGTITAFVDSTELTLAGDTFPDGDENYTIDFWTYHYYDGDLGPAAWVEVHGATQIDNAQYNDVATGLANFTANRYGVSWVFMEIDGLHFHVVYGQGDYKVNQAEEAGVPSSLPNIVTNYCALIAKIILQQGQTTMTITYPWTTVFTSSLATDHGSLGGLGDVADHDYALLHNGTRALSGAWDMGSQAVTNLNMDSGTIDGATITSPALNGTVTTSGLTMPPFTLGGTVTAGTNDITGVGTLKTARLTLTSDQLEEHATNGNAGTIALNFNGYNGGTTRFRDVDIYNGKQTRYGLFDGSASRFTVDNFGATALQGTINANGNAITNHAQAITDNAIVTVDGPAAGAPASGEYAKWTASGIEGRSKAEHLSDLNVADGADVTGSNAPQAHKTSHQNTGGDEISVAALSGLLADDQHVLGAEAVTAVEAAGVTFDENTGITIDSALSADGKYDGITEDGIAGTSLFFGLLVYLAVADGRWERAQANDEATAFGKLGICVLAAAGNGSATKVLLLGKVRADNTFPTLTVGAPVFISAAVSGLIVTTAPNGAGDIIRIVGYGNTADELFFCPDNSILQAGIITDGVTVAPTHDAVFDVKATADAAQTAGEVDADITTHNNVANAHGAVSTATASKIVVRDASARAKFAAPGAAGDAMIKGTAQTITELPALTTGKIWLGVGNRPVISDLPGIAPGEGHINIFPWNYNTIGQGTWVLSTTVSTALWQFFWYTSTSNDGDELDYKVYLAAGTYTIRLIAQKQSAGGIVDIDIDAVEIASFDLYNGSSLYNQMFTDTGNVIAASGLKSLTLRLDGKNGSSSSYGAIINGITLWRTA